MRVKNQESAKERVQSGIQRASGKGSDSDGNEGGRDQSVTETVSIEDSFPRLVSAISPTSRRSSGSYREWAMEEEPGQRRSLIITSVSSQFMIRILMLFYSTLRFFRRSLANVM